MNRIDKLMAPIVEIAILAIPAYWCLQQASGLVRDPDNWWHLRAGQWIVENRQLPTTDPFSAPGANKPWIAYSWLYEIVLYGLYAAFGLRGFVLYSVVMMVGIMEAIHALLRRLQSNRVQTIMLTALAFFGLIMLATPRPWLASILLFVLELNVLTAAKCSRKPKYLLWLLPLFALWSNVHIQFIYGLAVVGVAACAACAQAWFKLYTLPVNSAPAPPADGGASSSVAAPGTGWPWMLGLVAACLAATLLNPYTYHVYEAVIALVSLPKLDDLTTEMQALAFRSPMDWIVLGTTLAAAVSIGWRRQVPIFWLLLLLMGLYFSFKSRRDIWLVQTAAVCILADWQMKPTAETLRFGWLQLGFIAAAVAIFTVVCGQAMLDEKELQEAVDHTYPAEAAAFIEKTYPPGPLYNPFAWGGYLIWRLPNYPVNMDGRQIIHGQERILRHLESMAGQPSWQTDSELLSAKLVLVPHDSALNSILHLAPQFQLAYEDKIAAVYVPK